MAFLFILYLLARFLGMILLGIGIVLLACVTAAVIAFVWLAYLTAEVVVWLRAS